MSIIFILSVFVFIIAVIIVKPALKANIAIAAVLFFSFFSSWISVKVITGENYNETLYGGLIFGDIHVRLDALSAWFVLLTNFTVISGAIYGKHYLKHYQKG